MSTRTAVSIAVFALALGAGACGGEDKKTLGKAEFQKQANAICERYEKKGEAVPEPASGGSDADQLKSVAEYLEDSTPVFEGGYDELRDLEPEDDALAKRWDTYLGELKTAIDALKRAGDEARDGDKAGVQAAFEDVEAPDEVDVKELLGDDACD
jgi:hypothetical protein